jgi:DNA-binding MarR family transcriptional regulator
MRALERAMRDASGQGVLYSQAVAARLGINSTDLECLDVIIMRGPVAAGELARATGLTSGAITGIIDRLDRAGLAKREPDAADRRKVLVRALPAVERHVAPLFEPMRRAAMGALSSYDDKELGLLLGFFTRAHEAALDAMTTLGAMTAPGAETATSKTGRRGRAKG